jgi:hypothetical protein
VRADIYNFYGDKLNSVYLYHVENGIYMNSEIKAPSLDGVAVVYEIENSDLYSPVTERFFIDKTEVEEPKYILGLVKEKILQSEYTKGAVIEIASFK